MYKRDLGILVLAVFSVYFALQNEGPFTFQKAWYYPLVDSQTPQISTHHEILPKPVVLDLNGDGSLETVMVTHDYRLVVVKGRGVGREGDGFALGHLMNDISLRPSNFHTLAGQRPVGLAAGYIDKPSGDLVHRPRKAMVVVMTENWHVTCFDHNLNVLWKQDIHKEMHSHAVIHELAILITHHTVYEKDRGLIVIGGSMNMISEMEENLDADEDAFEVELDLEKKEEEMMHRLGEKGKEKEVEEVDKFGADVSRPFSYHAFEGGTGANRWNHIGNTYKHDMETLKDDLVPQRDYKVRVEHLSSMDYNEVSCRDYRESILHNLPHQWNQRTDTTFALSHFVKHKHGKGERKKQLASPKKKTPKSPCTGKKCKQDAVAKAIGKASEKVVKDGRKAQSNARPPNAIVAHLQEGIEAIHLYTGRSICKLPLPEGGLNVDLNGDGVLDHIQTTAGDEDEDLVQTSGHHRLHHCYAYATSGVPPREPFFNGSICRNSWSNSFSHQASFDDVNAGKDTLDIAPPAMLPIPTPRGEAKFRYGPRGYAMFLNNRGEMTAFTHRGHLKWMVSTDCTWHGRTASPLQTLPTLKAFPLRTHAFPTAVLVAGSHYASVVSEHGRVLTSFTLPDPPVLSLEIVDLNGDGLNDILLITNRMVYGYMQVQNLGGRPFGMLVLCLIVAMGTIYAAQHTGNERTKKVKRSTDRTD